LNNTSRPYTTTPSYAYSAPTVDSTDVLTHFSWNGSKRFTDLDTKVNFAGLIDTVVYSTFSYFFGDRSNDTQSSSDNETDRIAYGSTPYAGGTISWQEEILSWFETEIIGKIFLLYNLPFILPVDTHNFCTVYQKFRKYGTKFFRCNNFPNSKASFFSQLNPNLAGPDSSLFYTIYQITKLPSNS
jgi:hypothetical protein